MCSAPALQRGSTFAPRSSQIPPQAAGSPGHGAGEQVEAWGGQASSGQAELLKEACWGFPALLCLPPRPFARALCERVGLAWAHRGVRGWRSLRDTWGTPWPLTLRLCTAPSAAPGLATSHPGALIRCRQALGCSLSLPVILSEPRWNVGGLCGLGLPGLPELCTSSWSGLWEHEPLPQREIPPEAQSCTLSGKFLAEPQFLELSNQDSK